MSYRPQIVTLIFCLILVFSGFIANQALHADETAQDQTVTETVAAPSSKVVAFSSADIAWMLISSALVLMMTAPGLALFYGGLVRKKNILGVMMQCLFLMGLMSVVWALWGYSLAFADDMPGLYGFVGGFDKLLLNDVLPY